ncbi:RNA-directed DNA polymerase [Senna tora]|uniref:RNA-directed DNA polymerase n=1 Tax=Senna tora TaxID=362788 RepID=A0A834XDI8_9FABA|nr:RNA-directed DNA polymerase [Senna tora]
MATNAPRKPQERNPESEILTMEEKDGLRRSVKKIKRHGSPNDKEDALMAEVENPTKEEIQKPVSKDAQMEDSILQPTPRKEDEIMEEISRAIGEPRQVRRALWSADEETNLSYKDRLLGINGRKEGFISENEDEEIDLDLEGEEEQPITEDETELICPTKESDPSNKNSSEPIIMKGDNRKVEIGEEALGPWMHVQHNPRRRPRGGQSGTRSDASKEQNLSSGSRFQAIAKLQEKEGNDDTNESQSNEPQGNLKEAQEEQLVISQPPPKEDAQTQNNTKGVKVKTRKMELASLTPKKSGGPPHHTSDNGKTKPPHEKASEHIIITSAGVSRKQHNQASPAKSIQKLIESANKAASKTTTEETMPKTKKPPDYEEQLRMMKGAASKSFPSLVRDLFNIYNLDILTLYETRTSGERATKIIQRCGINNFIRIEAEGYSGGIWILWNNDDIHITLLDSAFQIAHCCIEKQGSRAFCCTFLYANPNNQVKDYCWQKLESIASDMDEPWVVMGDFNSYLFAHEKQGGGAPNNICMDRFSRCISNCNLVDLGFEGPKFTWKRNDVMERLDRAFGNQVWVSNFSNYSVFILPSFKSDHNAILLKPTVHRKSSNGEKPFRFQAAWLTHSSFEDLVADHWNQENWLGSNLGIKIDNWNSKFVLTCWVIWKRRSNWIFQNTQRDPLYILATMYRYMDGLKEANIFKTGDSKTVVNEELLIRWYPPETDWVKLNVDGSCWTHTGAISCGGVLRDGSGRWILGFTRRMGRGNSTMAEAWAIKTGLEKAWELNLKRVIVESDSLSVINMIKKGLEDCHPLNPIINGIRYMASLNWEVTFDHVFRESNRVANSLANWAQRGDFGVVSYNRTPVFCSTIVQDDARGVYLPRGFAN